MTNCEREARLYRKIVAGRATVGGVGEDVDFIVPEELHAEDNHQRLADMDPEQAYAAGYLCGVLDGDCHTHRRMEKMFD